LEIIFNPERTQGTIDQRQRKMILSHRMTGEVDKYEVPFALPHLYLIRQEKDLSYKTKFNNTLRWTEQVY
jgi:hypothetical protein